MKRLRLSLSWTLLVAATFLSATSFVGGKLERGETSNLLKFRDEGHGVLTFKIAQFADLHFGEGERTSWGPLQDVNSTRVMRNVLQAERPDFVVFSGDQVTGNNIHDNATAYWGQALKPVLEAGYRWSIVFGNHDDLADGTNGHREDLLKFDTSFPNSYSQFGPRDIHGLSNYYLAIYPPSSSSSDELPPVPLSLLYFLDSGGGTIPEIVYPDQVEWYLKTSAMLQSSYSKALPALAFFHIPTEQYVNAFNPQVCFGVQQDDIAPQQSSNGLLDAFQKMGDVKASFVGHNHGNDWCCPTKQGIKICYGRHTGYGGYGTWARGSRIIQIQIEKSSGAWKVQSWVRMEDGTVVDGGTIAATP